MPSGRPRASAVAPDHEPTPGDKPQAQSAQSAQSALSAEPPRAEASAARAEAFARAEPPPVAEMPGEGTGRLGSGATYLRQFELIEKIKAYDPSADEDLLNRAYVYAVKMHGSQKRASGDPYFAHPVQVAGILTEYRLDTTAIVTALLHDVIEDTDASKADIARLFGEDVAELVEGVTKLSRLELQAEHVRQAENLRKFILAVSKDVRVLLVKLADRLHNMRTLQYVRPAKRERISRETLEVYAPLGRSIGIHRIASELEELAFGYLNPTAKTAIERRLEGLKLEHGRAVSRVSRDIERHLTEGGMSARVFGREKTPYSIWRKLQRKAVGFSALSDIYAFRVITASEDECYRALGIIHRAYSMVPERFKDFISTPKSNNYRSLHTTVIGPAGMRIEMQIRTEQMDRVAEDGVAAHWRYKDESYGYDADAMVSEGGRDPLQNLRHLVQVMEFGGDADDWVEHAKLEMFLDQVFVFTPKGALISLPRGAMPLDFAYAVHTEVGDTAMGVKINGEIKPMRTPLSNGDVVEILRGETANVPPDWRSLAITGRARSAIKRHIRTLEKGEFQQLGRTALESALSRLGKELAEVSLRGALETLNLSSDDELFYGIGRGRISPSQAIEAVFPTLKDADRAAVTARTRIEDNRAQRLFVRGGGLTPGISVHFAPCCTPVPGDRIVGILRAGEEGMAIHTIDCRRLVDFSEENTVWHDLQWTPQAERESLAAARFRATIENAPGVLGQVATLIGEAGGNILNLAMTRRQQDFFDVEIDVEVTDARHATGIMAALRANPSVDQVERARG